MPYDTARLKAGGAMRHARHIVAPPSPAGACKASPQRPHTGSVWTGNSIQQASQIGTEERRGTGEPQRVQEAGRRAQLKLSKGLRSTRTTARQREVSDGGTSVLRMPKSLWKTHLASGRDRARCAQYSASQMQTSKPAHTLANADPVRSRPAPRTEINQQPTPDQGNT